MQTFLVSSVSPAGAHVTTRHYDAERASLDVISRMSQRHTNVETNVAGPADVVYAPLGRDDMTRTPKHKPAAHVAR